MYKSKLKNTNLQNLILNNLKGNGRSNKPFLHNYNIRIFSKLRQNILGMSK